MKFSVVIPLHNKAPYICHAVQSVLDQTFTDFEVVVIDDGSTDGGAELVRAMEDPRICVVKQANLGVSAARNRGISIARGDWVAFLDADDWFHPRHLAQLLETQALWPQAEGVANDFLMVADSRGAWPPFWPAFDKPVEVELITNLPRRWMIGPTLSSSSVAVKRRRLQLMQPCFPPGESHAEDLDFWFRLGEQSAIALAHVPLVAYRVEVNGSLTSGHQLIKVPRSFERMQARAESGVMTPAQRRAALWFIAQHKLTLARMALASGERVHGFQWLLKGRRAITSKRWWLTAAMACFCPQSLVTRWEQWRTQHPYLHVNMTNAEH